MIIRAIVLEMEILCVEFLKNAGEKRHLLHKLSQNIISANIYQGITEYKF